MLAIVYRQALGREGTGGRQGGLTAGQTSAPEEKEGGGKEDRLERGM